LKKKNDLETCRGLCFVFFFLKKKLLKKLLVKLVSLARVTGVNKKLVESIKRVGRERRKKQKIENIGRRPFP